MPDVQSATALPNGITHTVWLHAPVHASVVISVEFCVLKVPSGVAADSCTCAKCLPTAAFFAYCTPANSASFGPESRHVLFGQNFDRNVTDHRLPCNLRLFLLRLRILRLPR